MTITASDLCAVDESMFVNAFVATWNQAACRKLSIVGRLDPPAPDYLLSDVRGEFGLEVTELFEDLDAVQHRGSMRRRQRGERARQLTRLAAAYYEAGGPPLRLEVLLLRDGDLESLAEDRHPALVSRLLTAMAAGQLQVAIEGEYGEHLVRMFLTPQATGNSPPAQCSWWQCANDRTDLVGSLDVAVIERAIANKAARLPAYRQFARRTALLLVVNRTWAGGMCWWPQEVVALDTEGFDEVFFFAYGVPGSTQPILCIPSNPAGV